VQYLLSVECDVLLVVCSTNSSRPQATLMLEMLRKDNMGRHRRRWNICSVRWTGCNWLTVGSIHRLFDHGDEGSIHQKKRGGGSFFKTQKVKFCMIIDFKKLCNICCGGCGTAERK